MLILDAAISVSVAGRNCSHHGAWGTHQSAGELQRLHRVCSQASQLPALQHFST